MLSYQLNKQRTVDGASVRAASLRALLILRTFSMSTTRWLRCEIMSFHQKSLRV
jgi:hypothetical protein